MTTAPAAAPTTTGDALVQLQHVVKEFPVKTGSLFARKRERVHAVADVSLDVRRRETLALVGESGCGKSTLARCLMRLHDLTSGRVVFDGHDLSTLSQSELRPFRRRMQMVFQDPYGSLNPRRRVGSIIGDPFEIHGLAKGDDRVRRVQDLMELVGLNPEHYNRYPGDFSGGQRQRVGIARAIALRPDFIVCDEPVSALDVSIRAQILNLLDSLQDELGLTYLFISHDLSVVRHVSDRVAVMYLGTVVELGPVRDLYEHARHPYTRALLSAMPHPDPDRAEARQEIVLAGDPPSPMDPPAGCRFHPRCPRSQARCAADVPELASFAGDSAEHVAACHFPVADGEALAVAGASPPLPSALVIEHTEPGEPRRSASSIERTKSGREEAS
ncbi:MAG: oligopeptide/dipeptide ABC transporter ATP-binding protein [Acidobacteriota bacterium]